MNVIDIRTGRPLGEPVPPLQVFEIVTAESPTPRPRVLAIFTATADIGNILRLYQRLVEMAPVRGRVLQFPSGAVAAPGSAIVKLAQHADCSWHVDALISSEHAAQVAAHCVMLGVYPQAG